MTAATPPTVTLYLVVASCAVLKGPSAPSDGRHVRLDKVLYRGDVVPEITPQDEIDNLLTAGLIRPIAVPVPAL